MYKVRKNASQAKLITKRLTSNIQRQLTLSIPMVTQLERPDGSCVWNEMGYLKILNQKEKTVHTFLFYMVRHVMST